MFKFITIPDTVKFSKSKESQVKSTLRNAQVAAKKVEFKATVSFDEAAVAHQSRSKVSDSHL